MDKTTIAAALALSLAGSVVIATSAQAATRHVPKQSAAARMLGNFHGVYNQARMPNEPAFTTPSSDWENRSPFYRGPTYIGRY